MAERLAQRVLLVGWDAADWQLIGPLLQTGQMPHFQQVIARGVRGNLATLTPILSPLLWTSIATGKRADQHGILGFVEPDPASGQVRLVQSTSRRGKAVWNLLSQAGLRTHCVGWWASHPAEPIAGVCVSNLYALPVGPRTAPWPLPPSAVHPPDRADVLAALRVHPQDLGRRDLLPFVPAFAEPGPPEDGRLWELAVALAECHSISRAAAWILEHEPWDFLAVYFNALDHVGHHFMPYHPPRRPGIPEAEFERYQHVIVAMYRLQDALLGRLLRLAGPETTVLLVSDHGFYADERRPTAADRPGHKNARLWHRPVGVLAAAGPHLKRNAIVQGASILDITPTVLALLGLPIGEDMDGRCLTEAFAVPVMPVRIPSWEDVPGPAGLHPPGHRDNPWEAHEALRQLAALGYLDLPAAGGPEVLASVRTERTFNLAVHYLETGRPAQAVPHFEELLREQPASKDFRLYLARCRLQLGEYAACRELLAGVLAGDAECAHAHFLLGCVCQADRQPAEALAHLARAEQADPRLPLLHATLGRVYLELRRMAEAEAAFRRAAEVDPDSAQACLGLAHVALMQHRFPEAVAAARQAALRNGRLAEAHYVLGIALARQEQVGPALEAFQTCLRIDPRSATAHEWLAALHEQGTGDQVRAAEHRRRAAELKGRA